MRPHRGAMVLGLGLIIANGFSTGQFGRAWSVIAGAALHGQQPSIKNDLYTIIGEVIFLILLSTIAESSDTAESAVVVFLIALWLLWLNQNKASVSKWLQSSGSQAPNPPGGIPH